MAKSRNRASEVAGSAPVERTAPKLERDSQDAITIRAKHAKQLQRLYGVKTEETARILIELGLGAFGAKGLDYLELLPAMAVEMEPRDGVEAMLINQMTLTHYALSSLAGKAIHLQSYQVRESYERSMTRLNRTFLAQMDSLKKYRAKAQQTVRVERVEVKEGGQAVVGDVSYRRGADEER